MTTFSAASYTPFAFESNQIYGMPPGGSTSRTVDFPESALGSINSPTEITAFFSGAGENRSFDVSAAADQTR